MPPHSPTICTLRELARLFLALAAGELSEDERTVWFRDHLA